MSFGVQGNESLLCESSLSQRYISIRNISKCYCGQSASYPSNGRCQMNFIFNTDWHWHIFINAILDQSARLSLSRAYKLCMIKSGHQKRKSPRSSYASNICSGIINVTAECYIQWPVAQSLYSIRIHEQTRIVCKVRTAIYCFINYLIMQRH